MHNETKNQHNYCYLECGYKKTITHITHTFFHVLKNNTFTVLPFATQLESKYLAKTKFHYMTTIWQLKKQKYPHKKKRRKKKEEKLIN